MSIEELRFKLNPRYEQSHALIIGINQYKTFSPLSYAVSDAEGIRNILIDNLRFSEERIICLFDEQATKERILASFAKFQDDGVGLDDRMIVFFAGHGHTISGIRGETGFLVPYDARPNDNSTLIRWDELTRGSELIYAKHILFFMDACYGGLALNRSVQPGSVRFLKDMMLRYARQVLTAGKADEVVADSGGPLPNHSVFTGHLIEGLRGSAAGEHGIITANGLMAYVYNKVANDKNSRQTPHYGSFDGDGDFIISPLNNSTLNGETKDLDSLFTVPSIAATYSPKSIQNKVMQVKRLLADDSSTIQLHDLVTSEVRRFLSETSEDNFTTQGSFSTEDLLSRIKNYEDIVSDLCAFSATIAYWAKPHHQQILQKALARSTDRLDGRSGSTVLLSLRWYPLLLQMYCAGIASMEGQRYDSLGTVFYTKISNSGTGAKSDFLVEPIANAILDLNRANVFKQIPGHERYHTPLSEYLFKLLQPQLDDILYVGKNYENSFDEFELIFALVVADLRKHRGEHVWAPVGRFGWKHYRDGSIAAKIVKQAIFQRENWPALKAGLFGGSPERFRDVAEEYLNLIAKLNWY